MERQFPLGETVRRFFQRRFWTFHAANETGAAVTHRRYTLTDVDALGQGMSYLARDDTLTQSAWMLGSC